MMGHGAKRRMGALLATTFLVAVGGILAFGAKAQQAAGPSQVDQRRFAFNIAAKPLPQALNEIGRITGLSIVFTQTQSFEVIGRPVSGNLTADEALGAVLARTGISYRFTNARTVTIDPPRAASGSGEDVEGALVLDTINVSDSFRSPWQLNPDLPFETAAAVSVVTSEQLSRVPSSSAGDMLFGVPGVTPTGQAEPGLAVNIRGLQDFGRVNVMIDGVRQNFQYSDHGADGTVYVDPALVAGIEVERGAISTTHGSGTLGGAVNMRTLGIDDVLDADQKWGARATAIYGSNAYDWSGVLSGGARVTDSIDVFGAYSQRASGNYKNGDGEVVPYSQQDLQSGLFKVNLNPYDDHYVQLGGVFYQNDFGNGAEDQTVDSTILTAKYVYTPTDTDLISMRANGFVSRMKMEAQTAIISDDLVGYEDLAFGGDITNTSRFALGVVDVVAIYGGEFIHDKVDSSSVGADGNYALLTPSGGRTVGGVFSQTTFTYGIVDLIGGLRYDAYTLTGSGNNQYGDVRIVPLGPYEVDNSEGALLPRVTLALRPFDGVQLYATWAETFRPPATTEALISGAHPGAIGFINFSPNPFLKPEEGKGWEVGANYLKDGLFREGDKLRLKFDYYWNDVSDYIQYFRCGLPTCANTVYFYDNIPGITKLQGFEFEGSYDVGFAFANVSYQHIEADYPAAGLAGISDYKPVVPVPDAFIIAAGLRFFDEKLTLGARARYSSGQTINSPSGFVQVEEDYTIYDVFGSWKFSEYASSFFSVENITDVNYIPPLSEMYAPGLTAKVGLTVKLAD